MASRDKDLRRELGEERERLTDAVGELREEIADVKKTGTRVRAKLPIVAAVGALGAGFLKAGGLGATARLLFRRKRKSDVPAPTRRFGKPKRR